LCLKNDALCHNICNSKLKGKIKMLIQNNLDHGPSGHQAEASSAESEETQKSNLRAFMGTQAAKVDAIKQSTHTARLVVLGGMMVLATSLVFIVSSLTQDKAPEINLKSPVTKDRKAQPVVERAPVTAVVDLEVTPVMAWPEPSGIGEALAQVQLLKQRLSHSEEGLVKYQAALAESFQLAQEAHEKPKQRSPQMFPSSKLQKDSAKSSEDLVALSVLEVKPDRVLVASASNPMVKLAVKQGARLPGGALFIGYDPQTRLLKTDQGDFVIQADRVP